MDNVAEPSASRSFTASSSNVSDGSIRYSRSTPGTETDGGVDIMCLTKLSSNLEQLLNPVTFDYSDTVIVVEDVLVGVHRCVLAARSSFFCELFKKKNDSCDTEGKLKYVLRDILPCGKVGYEAFSVLLSYLYTGKLKPFPPEVASCVDVTCDHAACRPAIDFSVELMYGATVFRVPELSSLFQMRLLVLLGKALISDVIPILMAAFHCQLQLLVAHCVNRIARSDMDIISLEKELPYEVAEKLQLLRHQIFFPGKHNVGAMDSVDEKRARRIHKALDSDDVELVKLLLTESDMSLDDANALHYAVAYCDPKVVSEVLSLNLANVNLRNSRGYTVLHVAAMRKELAVIVSLLENGASALDLTLDGRSVVTLCRRLTRAKDYHAGTDKGQKANMDRICIDILEREMKRNHVAGNAVINLQLTEDNLHLKLLHFENRVAFARIFFPMEAKLAMDIAHIQTSSKFEELFTFNCWSGSLREVDLNESPPSMQNQTFIARLEALMKTVEMGRRYFPNCSTVLDKLMEDDLPDLLYLERGTAEEQRTKRARFMELKDEVQRAFEKDNAENKWPRCSSSSSSCSSSSCSIAKKCVAGLD